MDRGQREALDRALHRLAEGDRDAFDGVFVAVWPLVQRFAQRLLRSSADADDVAQLALLKVFERIHQLDRERPALPWILGIAAYEVKTLQKRTARRKEELSPGMDCASFASPERTLEEAILARDLEESVLEVLGTLRPSDLETIKAAILEHERPAISAASFRKRLQRALERLRKAWREKHGT